MLNFKDFAINLISRNPRVANNPQAQEMIEAIRTNDVEKGQMIAKNICDQYGKTPDEMVTQAKQFFNI